MMVHVLQRLKPSGILDEFSNLAAYVAHGEARPAYQRAFAAQLAVNTGKGDRLIKVRPGLDVVISIFVQFIGPDPRDHQLMLDHDARHHARRRKPKAHANTFKQAAEVVDRRRG